MDHGLRDRWRRRFCGCSSLVNTLGIALNLVGIILDLLLFPQTGGRQTSGWCDYAMTASILFHAFTITIYAVDIWRPLRISFRFCTQLIVYLIALSINAYHFGWIFVGLKTQPSSVLCADTKTSTPASVVVEYKVSVVLIWEVAMSMTNFVWLVILTILSGCHYCSLTESNAAEDELVEIAINQSLAHQRLASSRMNTKLVVLDPDQFTAEDILNCIYVIDPPLPPLPPPLAHSPIVSDTNSSNATIRSILIIPNSTPSEAGHDDANATTVPTTTRFTFDLNLPGSISPTKTTTTTATPTTTTPITTAAANVGEVVTYVTVREIRVCGHRFHESCLMQWLLNHRHNTCPVCRGPIVVRIPPMYLPSRKKSPTSDYCTICTDLLWNVQPHK
jgi:hypothetical protein